MLQPAEDDRGPELGRSAVQAQVAEPLQERLEGDAGFQPGQGGAQAVVDAASEGNVAGVGTGHVQLVGAVEPFWIVVGAADEQGEPTGRPHLLAADLRVVDDEAPVDLHGES